MASAAMELVSVLAFLLATTAAFMFVALTVVMETVKMVFAFAILAGLGASVTRRSVPQSALSTALAKLTRHVCVPRAGREKIARPRNAIRAATVFAETVCACAPTDLVDRRAQLVCAEFPNATAMASVLVDDVCAILDTTDVTVPWLNAMGAPVTIDTALMARALARTDGPERIVKSLSVRMIAPGTESAMMAPASVTLAGLVLIARARSALESQIRTPAVAMELAIV